MKRSDFLKSASILGAMPLMGMKSFTETDASGKNKFIELIKYSLHPGIKQKLVENFYNEAAIPAFNRIGIKNVGVFNPVYGPESLSLFVLIPHQSLDAVYTDNEKLLEDKEYLKLGDKFLNSSINDSAFVKAEKTLLRAFDYFPEIKIQENLKNVSSSIFEIRIYQSPSVSAAKKKIQMFCQGGEIEIFKRTGLQPVLFGETIIGQQMPNLHYMLTFENIDARDKAWVQFRTDPEWQKLKSDLYYADLVSNITDIILKPASCSQI
jgi:hypothetical protein